MPSKKRSVRKRETAADRDDADAIQLERNLKAAKQRQKRIAKLAGQLTRARIKNERLMLVTAAAIVGDDYKVVPSEYPGPTPGE